MKQEREALLAASVARGAPFRTPTRRLFYAERHAFSPRDPLMPVGKADGVSPSCSAHLPRTKNYPSEVARRSEQTAAPIKNDYVAEIYPLGGGEGVMRSIGGVGGGRGWEIRATS